MEEKAPECRHSGFEIRVGESVYNDDLCSVCGKTIKPQDDYCSRCEIAAVRPESIHKIFTLGLCENCALEIGLIQYPASCTRFFWDGEEIPVPFMVST